MRVSDTPTYRRCLEPFPTATTAKAAVEQFLNDVAAAREHHRISDVVVLAEVSALEENGQEKDYLTSASFGHYRNKVYLLAQAYGEALALIDTCTKVRAP